jgi:hypothetical protein
MASIMHLGIIAGSAFALAKPSSTDIDGLRKTATRAFLLAGCAMFLSISAWMNTRDGS